MSYATTPSFCKGGLSKIDELKLKLVELDNDAQYFIERRDTCGLLRIMVKESEVMNRICELEEAQKTIT